MPALPIAARAALLGAALALAAGAAPAQPAPPASAAQPRLTPAELDALRAQQRRDAFQQLQRNLREQDRARAGAPQPSPQVPILRPGTRIRPFGNSYAR